MKRKSKLIIVRIIIGIISVVIVSAMFTSGTCYGDFDEIFKFSDKTGCVTSNVVNGTIGEDAEIGIMLLFVILLIIVFYFVIYRLLGLHNTESKKR